MESQGAAEVMHAIGAYHALYDMILDFVMTGKGGVLC